jgi:hypothetical protein
MLSLVLQHIHLPLTGHVLKREIYSFLTVKLITNSRALLQLLGVPLPLKAFPYSTKSKIIFVFEL